MIDTMLHYEQTDAGLRAQNNGRKKEDTKLVISRPDGMQDTKNARDNRSLWIFRDSH